MPAAKPTPGTLVHTLELGELLGSTWEGFRLVGGRNDSIVPFQGEFGHESWRRPFAAGELRRLFWTSQFWEQSKYEVAQLRRDMAHLAGEIESAEARAEFYRRQLRLESRAGLMLAHILTP